MHLLNGPRLKIRRAEAEFDRLRLMQDAFFENTHYTIVRAEQNPKSGKYIYRISIDVPPPSLDRGIYIGEIARNPCSAPNQLIYQLALLNSANEPKALTGDRSLRFPIFLDGRDFKAKGKHMIKLLYPEHKTSIEGLQPYNSLSSPCLKTIDLAERSGSGSPLFGLEEIDNADKHRIIQVVGARAVSVSYAWWGERGDPLRTVEFFKILKDGAEFAESPEMGVNPQLSPLIAFTDGCDSIATKQVCLLSTGIADAVSDIIEMLASEF